MASFPASVKSFATRSNGQTIDATHVNDLQDEVNAVEDGYLNGTARLNSSNSTVATLSVTGGSTFATRPVMPPTDAARVQLADALELAADSTTAVSWTTQAFQTNSSLHSTATNPMRLTPQTTGVYWVSAQLGFAGAATSSRCEFGIEDSSGANIAFHEARTDGNSIVYGASGLKRFDVTGGWARVVVLSRTSTNRLSTGGSFFSIVKL